MQLPVFMLAATDPCSFTGGSARPAFAAEGGAGLRFEYARAPGAADCPDAEAVRAGVIARLGHDPFSPDGEHRLHCAISGDRSGRRAQIELRDGAGRVIGVRTLSSKRRDCAELGPALLVVIASASARDESTAPGAPPTPGEPAAPERPRTSEPAAARQPSPSGEPAASGQPAPAAGRPAAPDALAETKTAVAPRRPAEASPRTPATPTPTAASPFGFSVSAGATFGAGSGPAWAGGGLVGAGVRRGWGSLELELFATLPSSKSLDGGRIVERAAGVSFIPCAHRGPLAACALVEAGFLFGRGEDLPGARSGRVPWVATGVRAAWRLRLRGRLALNFHADGLLVPTRTDVYAGGGVAWTRPVWAAAGGVTFVVELGRSTERQTDAAHNGQY